MKLVFVLLVLLFFPMSFLNAQDSLIISDCNLDVLPLKKKNAISLQSSYVKTGLYAGLAWNSNFHKGWNVNMSLSSKIRHLSLRKFTPMISLGVGYDILKDNWKIDLVPGFKGQLVTSRLTETSVVNNVEMLFGYEFVLGDRYKLVQGAYYGFGHESSENFNVRYSSFLIHIGFGYVFSH